MLVLTLSCGSWGCCSDFALFFCAVHTHLAGEPWRAFCVLRLLVSANSRIMLRWVLGLGPELQACQAGMLPLNTLGPPEIVSSYSFPSPLLSPMSWTFVLSLSYKRRLACIALPFIHCRLFQPDHFCTFWELCHGYFPLSSLPVLVLFLWCFISMSVTKWVVLILSVWTIASSAQGSFLADGGWNYVC